jgi:hypothetical protein
MRKETKKLKHPNVIIDSLEKPVYASTDISYSCNVNGPECNEDPISEDDYWKSGWKDANDFGNRYSDAWDFHICPDCQETNCMKCFDGVINKDNSQCSNKNCKNHTHCKDCGEEFFTHPYGDDYCINPDCENSGGDTTPKLATRNYWIQCDMPECESDGWNPEYDRMPEGWHRNEHDRYGDHSTDYCKDCWNDKVCHDCATLYSDEELKFPVGERVCVLHGCPNQKICPKCESSFVNDFGNCRNPTDYPNYDCKYCRHCNQEVRPTTGSCPNKKCKAYEVPLYKQIFGE